LLAASASLPLALLLRVGTEHLPDYSTFLSYGTPLFCAIAAGVFPHCGLYQGLWRYVSLPDLAAIVKGATISVLLFVVLAFIFERVQELPRSVPVIQVLCLITLLGASRFLRRALLEAHLAVDPGDRSHPRRHPDRRRRRRRLVTTFGARRRSIIHTGGILFC
jgi:FlaA1/EpsC-like NDP-sugar epimerase